MANRQASEDMQVLAQLESEAAAASSGLAWVKLGEAYASYGQYDKAIAALQKGIQKGGLQNPEDAKLDLGIAYLHSGQKAKAKEILVRRDRWRRRARPGPALADRGRGRIILRGIMIPHSINPLILFGLQTLDVPAMRGILRRLRRG